MPLSEKQIDTFKERLLGLRAELEESIAEAEAPADMGSDVESDWSEEAEEAEEFGKKAGMRESFKRRLHDVNAALSKIEKGTYGVCEECGKEIEFDILSVDPESRYCKASKALLE